VFSQFATKIRAGGGNLTVYASAADRALVVSRWLWGRQRVGYIAGGTPELIDGVDLIDITRGLCLEPRRRLGYAQYPVGRTPARQADRGVHVRHDEEGKVLGIPRFEG
jgi:hypothetical protein